MGAYSLATISTAPEYTVHFPRPPPLVVGASRDLAIPVGEGLWALLGLYESDEESNIPAPVAPTNNNDPPGPMDEESLAAPECEDPGDHGADTQPTAMDAEALHPSPEGDAAPDRLTMSRQSLQPSSSPSSHRTMFCCQSRRTMTRLRTWLSKLLG